MSATQCKHPGRSGLQVGRLLFSTMNFGMATEWALPLVLSLLDQLYDVRRRTRELGEALALSVPEKTRRGLALHPEPAPPDLLMEPLQRNGHGAGAA